MEAISRGVSGSGIFVLVLTAAAIKSPWIKMEASEAVKNEHQDHIRLFLFDRGRVAQSLSEPDRFIPSFDKYQLGVKPLFNNLNPLNPAHESLSKLDSVLIELPQNQNIDKRNRVKIKGKFIITLLYLLFISIFLASIYGIYKITTNEPYPTTFTSVTDTPTSAPNNILATLPTKTPLLSSSSIHTPTLIATETSVLLPTDTPSHVPTATSSPVPVNTSTNIPTETIPPLPTNTLTPLPTKTLTPLSTNIAVLSSPIPTSTNTPWVRPPTRTPIPTNTPQPTHTPTTLPTSTNTPLPTNTPIPTNTPLPTPTPCPIQSTRLKINGPNFGITATINSPQNCDVVESSGVDVGGSFSGNLEGKELWMFVYPHSDHRYYVQAESWDYGTCENIKPVTAQNGSWTSIGNFGGEPQGYDVVLMITEADSKASQDLKERLVTTCNGGSLVGYAELPDGLAELASITVEKK